jgi:hypothetical protein
MKSWTKPTPEQIDRVIGKLARPGAHRYFFAKLQNPEWVEPLRAKGFFASPPPVPRDHENGVMRIPDWPEADYLARVAAEAPELVTDIVLQMPEITNERVHRSLTALALNLPPQLAAQLIDKIVTWKPIGRSMTLSMRLPHLVAHLAEGGRPREALRLAQELFAFESEAERDSGGLSFDKPFRGATPKAGMDLWEYNEALKVCMPALARAHPLRAIYLLVDLLDAALRGSDLVRTGEREVDISSARTSDLEAPDGGHPTSFEDLLARILSRVAIAVIQEGGASADKVVFALNKRNWLLYRAITLYVLADVSPLGAAEAKAKILDRALFEGGECQDQYARLVRSRFAELAPDERAALIAWIEDGPDLKTRAKNYERFYGRPASEEELEQGRKAWTRDRLSWLGAENLSPDTIEQLRLLVTELGEPEQDHPFGKISWWGPSSPKTDEEFEAMPLPALVEFLRSWVPSEDGQASRAGLGRQLQAAARSRPAEFSAAADTFVGLPPIYVHHLIWGVDEAARLGTTFDVSTILVLCGWMVEQPRGEEPDDRFPFRADEQSWAGARRACASLIGTLLDRKLPPLKLRAAIWKIIRELTEDPNPAPGDEREPDFEATTRSLNCIRGEAMHAVMKYGRWLWQVWEEEGDKREHSFEQLPEVREVLERRLDRSVESTLTVRSIYGQYFPLLTYFDPGWAADAVDAIFPEDDQELWWGAWIPYLQFGGAYDNVFRLLRRQYGVGVANLPPEEVKGKRDGWVEHLGSHLMVFYWRGLIGLGEDDLIACFMGRASPRLRRQALNFVGRSLLNTEGAIPRAVLERLKALWESRVQAATESDRDPTRVELAAFVTWFLSAKFDDAWAIDQLHPVTELIDGDASNAFPLIKRLAALAPQMPDEAIQILERLLFNPKRSWQYVASISEVGEILKAALDSTNAQAAQGAVRIVDKLAERGEMTYRPLVAQVAPTGSA